MCATGYWRMAKTRIRWCSWKAGSTRRGPLQVSALKPRFALGSVAGSPKKKHRWRSSRLARRMADPRFRFVMTGAGPLESKVRRRVRRLPTGTVSFLGVVDDIDAHLASLDVLVVPSIMDGRPVVVLEALALGSRSSLPASADFPRWSVKGRPVSSSSQVTRMRSLGICGVASKSARARRRAEDGAGVR